MPSSSASVPPVPVGQQEDDPLCPMDPPSSPDSDVDSADSFGMPDSKATLAKTLTLYDWDDTFLPSTYLASLGLRVDDTDALPRELTTELAALETQVIAILKEAARHGPVKIITNAEEGWIELSGARFMPRLTSFLEKSAIKLVSARTQYEADYPDNPSSWKIAAFAAEVEETFPAVSHMNVLVLGDSLSERDAAHALSARMPTSCVKSVKLVERPTISQLHRQITLLHGSFQDLRNHYGSFDVNLAC